MKVCSTRVPSEGVQYKGYRVKVCSTRVPSEGVQYKGTK